MLWNPRSAWEQAEFPRPPDRWAQRIRSVLSRLVGVGAQTYIPYHKRDVAGNAGLVRVWQRSVEPVVALKGYTGEAFLVLQGWLDKPHPSGISSDAPLMGVPGGSSS